MVKPLSFKGDKKVKKRKHKEATTEGPQSATLDPTTEGDSEETWTTADTPSDLSGPIMILLPSTDQILTNTTSATVSKPSCLACDSAGTVFPSAVENMIPETPVHLSAEPSDVRQVWVVSKVPGEDSGWTMKNHQGKYLSADRFGVLRCEREAVGMEEVFWLVEAGIKDENEDEDKDEVKRKLDGAFYMQTSRKTYISVSTSTSIGSGRPSGLASTSIRADAETPESRTCTLHIRMQSRFKPRVKATRELKAKEKVSRKQLEEAVGRRLDEDEVRRLKKARRDGGWHEAVLDARVKGSHDKFA